MKIDFCSPCSSPPTPPSPLPISVGPGYQKYFFSSSPSPSPPFSPPSSHTSSEYLPVLYKTPVGPPRVPSTFSLDRRPPSYKLDSQISCVKDLLKWLMLRVCCLCSSKPSKCKTQPCL